MKFPEVHADTESLACARLAMILLLVLPAILVTPGLQAATADRSQPIEILANSSDSSTGKGITILEGDVSITQGSLRIEADRGEIRMVEGRVNQVLLTGTPVSLEQLVDNKGQMQARARRVQYDAVNSVITLTGSAQLNHPQGQVNGETIRYDLVNETFQGTGSDERVRILLEPPAAEDTAAEPPITEDPDDSP